ncbi:MAG: DeoR/GlpR family DNA-binding transcription regulator [Sphaerochaetaceae bacterium]|jgi:DeoR/GlpR family transcriptional regulator of sugar metabolism
MQSPTKRKQYIQKKLEEEQTVQVSKLAEELSVSEMTIRRDLTDLEQLGVLKKTHGGALKAVSRSYEPPFSLRQHKALDEKRAIAKEALKFINEGDTIALDSGTTTVELAKELVSYTNLTIATTSIHIATIFLNHPTIVLLLSGGILRKHEGSLVGSFAQDNFSSFYFDAFFVSGGAISSESGLTDYIIEDAAIKRLIMSHSKKTVALMIGEKFDQSAFVQFASLGEVDVLISGKTPSLSLQQALQKEKVTTIIAQDKEKLR